MPSPERRLKDLGIVLPRPSKPIANYAGFIRSGNLVFVAGQLPVIDGKLQFTGHLGAEVSVETGMKAARLCAINILAQINEAASGDLSRVARIVKLTGFVSCSADFADHAKVMNAASDLFADVFGERGKHARLTVGSPSLPLNAAVEIDAVAEIE